MGSAPSKPSAFAGIDLSQKKKFEIVPAGNYPARCYSIIDLGTHKGEWKGQEKISRQIRITWELPTEMKVFNEEKGEQPQVIGRQYTFSMSEKANLRLMLEGWRGKTFTDEEAKHFDENIIIGMPCMINVVHKEKTNGELYATVASVSQIPKGMSVADQINPSAVFCIDAWNDDVFDTLPDWIKEKILESEEVKKMKEEKQDTVPSIAYEKDINPEDLPF